MLSTWFGSTTAAHSRAHPLISRCPAVAQRPASVSLTGEAPAPPPRVYFPTAKIPFRNCFLVFRKIILSKVLVFSYSQIHFALFQTFPLTRKFMILYECLKRKFCENPPTFILRSELKFISCFSSQILNTFSVFVQLSKVCFPKSMSSLVFVKFLIL